MSEETDRLLKRAGIIREITLPNGDKLRWLRRDILDKALKR